MPCLQEPKYSARAWIRLRVERARQALWGERALGEREMKIIDDLLSALNSEATVRDICQIRHPPTDEGRQIAYNEEAVEASTNK